RFDLTDASLDVIGHVVPGSVTQKVRDRDNPDAFEIRVELSPFETRRRYQRRLMGELRHLQRLVGSSVFEDEVEVPSRVASASVHAPRLRTQDKCCGGGRTIFYSPLLLSMGAHSEGR